MHSLLSRANALFAFTLTVTAVLAVCLYATTFIYIQNGQVQIDSSRVVVLVNTFYLFLIFSHFLNFFLFYTANT